jgi:dihydroflavonol-4-reductase
LPWSSDKHTSAYSLSKYAAELEVQRGIAEGLDAVLVNPCVIIGPGQ